MILLDNVPYIYYRVHFRKRGKEVIQTLIDSGKDVNAMTLPNVGQLGLEIRQTNAET